MLTSLIGHTDLNPMASMLHCYLTLDSQDLLVVHEVPGVHLRHVHHVRQDIRRRLGAQAGQAHRRFPVGPGSRPLQAGLRSLAVRPVRDSRRVLKIQTVLHGYLSAWHRTWKSIAARDSGGSRLAEESREADHAVFALRAWVAGKACLSLNIPSFTGKFRDTAYRCSWESRRAVLAFRSR